MLDKQIFFYFALRQEQRGGRQRHGQIQVPKQLMGNFSMGVYNNVSKGGYGLEKRFCRRSTTAPWQLTTRVGWVVTFRTPMGEGRSSTLALGMEKEMATAGEVVLQELKRRKNIVDFSFFVKQRAHLYHKPMFF